MEGINLKGPLTVGLDITNRCNLRCRHCYANATFDSKIPDIPLKKILSILDELNELGTCLVSLAGGEPLIRNDLLSITRAIKERGMMLFLNTNGQLLTEKYAQDLKKNGVDHMEISIDGLENNHDAIRGHGSFKKAIEGFKNAKKAGIDTGIMTVISRQNMGDVDRLIKLFYGLGAAGIGFIRFKPVGRGKDLKDLELSPLERKSLIEKIYEQKILFDSKNFNIKVETPLSILVAQKYPDFMKQHSYIKDAIRGCPSGVISMHINADGTVTSCSQMPLTVGSIYDSTIYDLWNKSALFKKIRARKYEGKCSKCKHLNACGGCRTAAYLDCGNIMGADPGCWL
ncbi:MAG: radical SAM protein [Minisyncoccales bacterium]|jgi:radical SAM protein with 4Fe4S-binding SPASM domain